MSGPAYCGASVHSLDEKARLIVPKRLLDAIGDPEAEFVLTASPDGCLWLVDKRKFEALSSQLEGDLLDQAPRRRWQRRPVLGSPEPGARDKSGRILVPEVLRNFLQLGTSREVVVVGNGDVIELWSATAWRDATKPIDPRSLQNNTVESAAG